MYTIVAEELNLRWNQVKSTVDLLDDDNTVPFISRYRKEATGSLDEDQIRAIWDRIRYLRNLEERKATVLKSIDDQGKLTPELADKIKAAAKLQEVEDLYLPYKPKKRTRATIAREKGLEPLADLILRQETFEGDPDEIAAGYVDDKTGVLNPSQARSGARDIIAEIVSDDAEIRKSIRESTLDQGALTSEAKDGIDARDYEIYKEFSESVQRIPPHRVLAINRGERENVLKVSVDVDETRMMQEIGSRYIKNREHIFIDDLEKAIADAYHRLISPAIEREVRNLLTEQAEDHAIEVFAKNLRALLLMAPMRDKRILGIDPGYRTGCKVAAIDETGKYLQGATIYPHPPQGKWQDAKETIKAFVQDWNIHIIAIGNGTASRETEKLVADALSELDHEVYYTIVNEAGASVYSASPVAKQEFPELEASMRGNISIARRLLDPLSELVKIDPQSIGVGLYQHDVDQLKLGKALDQVVESAVNLVGVDLNTASASLLKYVAGINNRVAQNIVKFREENGTFKHREQLLDVKGLGDNAFLQSAGFLRIANSDIFFDSTAVHPESYRSAEKMISHLQLNIDEIRKNGSLLTLQLKHSSTSIEELATLCECGRETLLDIIESIEKPNRDPRDEMPTPILRNDVLSIDDLGEGMILKGTVRNVVDFGAFVDIGVKQDGLVHLSKMSKRYVKNPLDVVSVGDVVEVKVITIDKERGRIGLCMVLD